MPQSTVVITGLGVVTSIGIGADEFFDALLGGQSGITSLADRTDEGAKPAADSQPTGLWIGGPIVHFDAKQYVRPRKALKVMCREIQTSFAASQLAIQHAGLSDRLPKSEDADAETTDRSSGGSPDCFAPADIGTVFGSEMFYGPASEMEDAIRACFDDAGHFDESAFGAAAMKKVLPLWMLKYLPNMPACHVGIALGAHGPNNTLVLGDVSGPAAMIEAAGVLRRGIARMMIAGAAGTRINTTRMNYRGDLPIASVYNPLHLSSRPYDPASVGVVGGEAAASLVLENEADASARGSQGLARLVSHASRFIASGGMSLPLRTSDIGAVNARGSAAAIAAAIEGAIRSAGLRPSDIAAVVGHGMGDPVIDAAERSAIESTLPGVPVTSPIAALGHTGAASGLIAVVTGVMVIARKMIPPTIGDASPDGALNLVRTPRPLAGDHVLSLTHTSEGNATAIVLGSP